MPLKLKHFLGLIRAPKVRGVVFLCHPNADPDAVFSSYVLARLTRKLRKNLSVRIVAPEGINLASRTLLMRLHLPAEIFEQDHAKKTDALVLVDTSTPRQLGEWGEWIEASKTPLVIVDHHAPHPSTRKMSPIFVTDEHAASTCEIVFRMTRAFGYELTKKEAAALLCGLIFETKHFKIATPTTFRVAADLASHGLDVEETFSYFSIPMSRSERIARLKAARRVELLNISEWTVALTVVNSYQSSAARALVQLGADLAVAAGERKGLVRVNLRCTQDFHVKTRIHLGKDIAFKLGEIISGIGGGHPTNAGVKGSGNAHEVIAKAKPMLLEKIKKSTQLAEPPSEQHG